MSIAFVPVWSSSSTSASLDSTTLLRWLLRGTVYSAIEFALNREGMAGV